jgi:hypothetical protein
MKNDRKNVTRLAAQSKKPGTGAPGAAKPAEVEVVAVLVAGPVGLVPEEVDGDDEDDNTTKPPAERVPAVVNTKGFVLVLGGYESQRPASSVTTGSLLVLPAQTVACTGVSEHLPT